eukprot:NODE_6731_length_505_cov_10.706349_g6565_i0.p1 GENE.NODE_6731_length_505_cov_10.706349_g6565_i0~~NODE_6731_length_505_cov_10.706349_g6565_i0.p1  ORF type:complete len:146 (+),score=40.80 NODE_6731_length_505_cov_10.706349_g6565_i0:32-439(+)
MSNNLNTPNVDPTADTQEPLSKSQRRRQLRHKRKLEEALVDEMTLVFLEIEDAVFSIQKQYGELALSPLLDESGQVIEEVQKARRAYEELLLKQLERLDGLDSHNIESIRSRRKELVITINGLLEAYDRIKHTPH